MGKPTALAAALAAAALLAACSGAATAPGAAKTHQVRYEVTVTGSTPTTDDGLGGMPPATADLTIEGPGGTVQQADQPVPWSYTRTASGGDFLYVSAQNGADGDITCTITVDGAQVKTSTSSGEYAICQASGTL